ncbi:MAG: hypothetical protein J6D23_06765 [Clostridia bacterium]|nr:hypothetical protein [Clostridia bacterium]
MKGRIVLFVTLLVAVICIFAFSVNAECSAHTDNWTLTFGEDGVFGEIIAVNTCKECNLVLEDEIIEPLIVSLGYSYFNESFTQGFFANRASIEKYENYTKKEFKYGVVAAAAGVVGTNPVGSDATANSENAIVISMDEQKTEYFDIKVINISADKWNEKIIACAYAITDGIVIYGDNTYIDNGVAGISYNELVSLINDNVKPQGLSSVRYLTAEELGITPGSYWNAGSSANQYIGDNTSRKFSSTRRFSRDELPTGSKLIVGNGWKVRPELWKVNAEGNPIKGSRVYSNELKAGAYSIDDMWAKGNDYKYITFNISTDDGFTNHAMTVEGIMHAFKLQVPFATNVKSTEQETETLPSIEGLQQVQFVLNENMFKNSYYTSTGHTNMTTNKDQGAVYYATRKFTKEELPVGTVIVIEDGWMYRPEYWINDAKVGDSSRASVTSEYRFKITEDFWDKECHRAFNICTILKDELLEEGDFERVISAFKIYVPNTSTLYTK